LLDLLITSFETHDSFPATSQHFSLEEIRDFMRRRLARISTEFIFGRYTSVHHIIERFFKTRYPVTISDLMCPNGHVVDRHRSPTSSCEIIVFAQPGTSLQYCIDNFTHSTASKCTTCDTFLLRKTSFVQSPPVILFDLGTRLCTIPVFRSFGFPVAKQAVFVTTLEVLFITKTSTLHHVLLQELA
jgi:hypothetical protein